MRYRSQSVAYWYFAVAMVLFGLQLVFGLLSAAKYLGPDPLLYILPFDVTKVIHTNLLIVWVLTGFMGATYWLVPEESRTELHSVKLAYDPARAVGADGCHRHHRLLVSLRHGQQAARAAPASQDRHRHRDADVPLQHRHDDQEVRPLHHHRRRAAAGPRPAPPSCTLPALLHYENYTVSIFYRWWTIHLWVEGVWEMIQGSFLAYLLIRLSGADREVMEKWLYVIVGLVFIAGILGTAHHYYWVGVPALLAADRRHLQRAGAGSAGRHGDVRVFGDAPFRALPIRIRWRCTGRSAAPSSRCSAQACSALPHTWPGVNKWTHGTLITAMHGHAAFYGAYAMIVLAMISYALPALTPGRAERGSAVGYWSFWLQIAGMFGMTLSFATAGIGAGLSRADHSASAISRRN